MEKFNKIVRAGLAAVSIVSPAIGKAETTKLTNQEKAIVTVDERPTAVSIGDGKKEIVDLNGKRVTISIGEKPTEINIDSGRQVVPPPQL